MVLATVSDEGIVAFFMNYTSQSLVPLVQVVRSRTTKLIGIHCTELYEVTVTYIMYSLKDGTIVT